MLDKGVATCCRDMAAQFLHPLIGAKQVATTTCPIAFTCRCCLCANAFSHVFAVTLLQEPRIVGSKTAHLNNQRWIQKLAGFQFCEHLSEHVSFSPWLIPPFLLSFGLICAVSFLLSLWLRFLCFFQTWSNFIWSRSWRNAPLNGNSTTEPTLPILTTAARQPWAATPRTDIHGDTNQRDARTRCDVSKNTNAPKWILHETTHVGSANRFMEQIAVDKGRVVCTTCGNVQVAE